MQLAVSDGGGRSVHVATAEQGLMAAAQPSTSAVMKPSRNSQTRIQVVMHQPHDYECLGTAELRHDQP